MRDYRFKRQTKRGRYCESDCGFWRPGTGCKTCEWSQNFINDKECQIEYRAELIRGLKGKEKR